MLQAWLKKTRKRVLARKALTKPNLLYYAWKYGGNGYRSLKSKTPVAHAAATDIAEEIRGRGIVIGPHERFLSDAGQAAFDSAAREVLDRVSSEAVQSLITRGQSERKNKDFMVPLIEWDEEHAADDPIVRVALDAKLLEIVSSYFGMWPRLHAIGAWVNFPTDQEAKESQLWHRDPEDLQLIKVFMYLDDVDLTCGPFSYVPKTHPFSEGAGKIPIHKDKKRITDEEMRATFPEKDWVRCTGPAGTMILADTVGYHRGGKPEKGRRILITFTYASGTPLTKRALNIKGRPDWASNPIQAHAI